MTTEEVKKAIENKINEIDTLKLELTEMIFANQQVIENDEYFPNTNGYIGGFKVVTENKTLRFAVNNNGWLSSFDNNLVSVEKLPCIKNFIIAKENEQLKARLTNLKNLLQDF